MTKTIRKVTDLVAQQEETYLYWQSVSDSERMNATWEFTLEMYRMKGLVKDVQGLQRSEPRTTKDLGLFVRPDPENAPSVFQALAEYGTPLADTTVADL